MKSKLPVSLWTIAFDLISCVAIVVTFGSILRSNMTFPPSAGTIHILIVIYLVVSIVLATSVLNVITVIQFKKHGYPLAGPIVGLVAACVYVLVSILAIIPLIIAAVLTYRQQTTRNG